MTDRLVEQLRALRGDYAGAQVIQAAADTIERWQAALTYISEHGDRPADQLALEALFALEGKMSPQSNQEQDLTKRLRGENWWLNVTGEEAAAEIERLRELVVKVAATDHELQTDIVERLRETIPWCQDINDLNAEAAAEIERLRQDNAEMRELINTLAEGRALEPKP